jgi:hypothetical protein
MLLLSTGMPLTYTTRCLASRRLRRSPSLAAAAAAAAAASSEPAGAEMLLVPTDCMGPERCWSAAPADDADTP